MYGKKHKQSKAFKKEWRPQNPSSPKRSPKNSEIRILHNQEKTQKERIEQSIIFGEKIYCPNKSCWLLKQIFLQKFFKIFSQCTLVSGKNRVRNGQETEF